MLVLSLTGIISTELPVLQREGHTETDFSKLSLVINTRSKVATHDYDTNSIATFIFVLSVFLVSLYIAKFIRMLFSDCNYY